MEISKTMITESHFEHAQRCLVLSESVEKQAENPKTFKPKIL